MSLDPIVLMSTTVVGTGAKVGPLGNVERTYQASIAGTGALTGTVVIEGSNDNVNYLTIGTITLSGTTSDSDGFVSSAPWTFVRARVPAAGITGTAAVITVTLGR